MHHRSLLMVHIHWTSDALDPWSHVRLYNFPGNKLYGIHKCTVFFHHIVTVSDKKMHNMVKKNYIHMHTTLLVSWEIIKPCMRSRISCIRCSLLSVCAPLLLTACPSVQVHGGEQWRGRIRVVPSRFHIYLLIKR